MKTKLRRGIPVRASKPDTAQLLRRKNDQGKTFRARMLELRGKDTVDEFAARCGAPVTTAREWLKGGKGVLPSAEYLNAMADGYGVTIDWILGRPGAPKYPDQTRTDAQLESDVAASILRTAMPSFGVGFTIEVDGAAVLRRAAEDVAAELVRYRQYVSLYGAALVHVWKADEASVEDDSIADLNAFLGQEAPPLQLSKIAVDWDPLMSDIHARTSVKQSLSQPPVNQPNEKRPPGEGAERP